MFHEFMNAKCVTKLNIKSNFFLKIYLFLVGVIGAHGLDPAPPSDLIDADASDGVIFVSLSENIISSRFGFEGTIGGTLWFSFVDFSVEEFVKVI